MFYEGLILTHLSWFVGLFVVLVVPGVPFKPCGRVSSIVVLVSAWCQHLLLPREENAFQRSPSHLEVPTASWRSFSGGPAWFYPSPTPQRTCVKNNYSKTTNCNADGLVNSCRSFSIWRKHTRRVNEWHLTIHARLCSFKAVLTLHWCLRAQALAAYFDRISAFTHRNLDGSQDATSQWLCVWKEK